MDSVFLQRFLVIYVWMLAGIQYRERFHNFLVLVFPFVKPLVNCKAVKVVEQPKIDWANPPAELIEDVISKLWVVQLPMDVNECVSFPLFFSCDRTIVCWYIIISDYALIVLFVCIFD